MARITSAFVRALLATTFIVSALTATDSVSPQPAAAATMATSAPYWITNPHGSVWNFGSARAFGDLSGIPLNQPIVGIAPTPSNNGYWLVARDGGIFTFGDARFFGSTGHIRLNQPIVGMAPTPTGKGYWMVASDGGIFTFGDARFFGSTGSLRLNQPIVAMAPTPTSRGYWLVASDGGIFTFGDARFFGSTGSLRLNRPIVAMASTPTSKGYWLVASDGGIFTFGDAKFYGSAGGSGDNSYAKILPASDGRGYWLVRNGGDGIAYGAVGAASASSTTGRPAVGLVHTISGPRDLAIDFAMRQRGKPYAWGGAGPDGFDCSGLTLRAWQAAGVNLPRIANDQYNAGRRIPFGELRAGDLVFWASDVNNPRSIHHVAIYLGGGNVITAPKAGDVVRSSQIWSAGLMPFGVRLRD